MHTQFVYIIQKLIIFDGGVRTGTDMFKALCLGADYVCIGRPAIWGLILNGSDGVSQILNLFYQEFRSIMGLSGCNDINGSAATVCDIPFRNKDNY